jgi:two-component system response regulator NreC
MSDLLLSDNRLNQKHWSDLRAEASPFRSAFEYAAIGMVLADTDGRCLAANRAFCEMVGYTEDELLQLEFAQLTHPDDLPENLRLGRQLISGEIASFKYEKRYRHKQGQIVWALLSASLVRDDHGHPLYIISQIQDITERKHAELAERAQRELAEALRDAVQALSSTHNLDELLDRILQSARRIAPHDASMILLLDEAGDAYMARYRDDTGRSNGAVINAARFSVTKTANLHLMAELRRPLVIADVNHYPGWIHLENEPRARSYLGAPICLEDQVIGFISLRKVESDFFTREHAERLQTLAQQAAIALENARSFEAERQKSDMAEALRETAAALNSTLNLEEVFDRILSSAVQVVPYDAINIMLMDEAGIASVVRARGYEEFGVAAWVGSLKMNVQETYGLLNITRTHQPYRVPDTQADPSWVSFPETSWQRSYIGAPIRLKGKVVGFLNFDSVTPHFFTAEQARRAQIFADQVALAIQNAQSYEAIQRHVRRLTLLHQISVEIALAQTAPQLHQQIVRAARQLVEADTGGLLLFDQQDQLVITAVEGLPPALLGRAVALGRGINGRAAQLRQLQHINDYLDFDDRLPIAENHDISGVAAVPLIWQDRLVGTLCVINRQPRQFDEDDLHVLNLYGALAAAALEQRRAMSEGQAREAEARSLSSRLANAQEEERTRIASLLHDAIGGQLTLIQKNTELLRTMLLGEEAAVPYLDANLEMLQRTHQQVRHLAMDLNSKALSELGLIPAARQHVDRLCASTGLPITLHFTGHARRLPLEIERLAFRALQETLNNALRHAGATEISAQLHLGNKSLRLTVQDNGRGFEEGAWHHGTSLGLPHLRQQVEQLDGDLFVESSPGNGTIIALRLPLRAAADNGGHRTRVLVVDDHEIMRQGLRHILAAADDLVCVGEASDGHAALSQIEAYQPDLIIMDVKLPGGSGIETTRQLTRRHSHARVIIYTYHDDETYLEQAIQAGAKGYLLKSDPNQLLLTALRTVQAGEIFISPTLADKWAKLQHRPNPADPIEALSSRERQVLQLVASGHSNPLIAERLQISVRTVEVHRRNIMDKLGVKNAAGLIKFAVEHGVT